MQELDHITEQIDRAYRRALKEFRAPPLSRLPEPYRNAMRAYLLRKGKRFRPALFMLSYYGYAEDEAPEIYTSAVALEMLHNFTLMHDDLIDRSRRRRGGPAMHVLFADVLDGAASSFSAESLAMLAGDMMYALGIRLFMAVEEDAERKQAALSYLTEAALYTACGEFRELLHTLNPVELMSAESISEISRWKTAYYSFVCPMVTGALLGGASESDVKTLARFGVAVGLAYQIQDDIDDLHNGHAARGGGAEWEDLRDGKRMLPLWYAVRHGAHGDRTRLAGMFNNATRSPRDVKTARDMILRSGGLQFAESEARRHLNEGRAALSKLSIRNAFREALWNRTERMFEPERNRTPTRRTT